MTWASTAGAATSMLSRIANSSSRVSVYFVSLPRSGPHRTRPHGSDVREVACTTDENPSREASAPASVSSLEESY